MRRPLTLRARMMLLLLLGLILAQAGSIAINVLDRGQAFYRSTTLQVAQHIADLSKALDAVTPSQRARMVRVLNDRHLSIVLFHGPDTGGLVSEKPYADAFRAMIRRDLGPGWPLHVILMRTAAGGPAMAPLFSDDPDNVLDRYLTARLFYLAPRGFSFITHIRLHDGTWVTFSSRLPYEHIARLYVLLPKILLILALAIGMLLIGVRWATRPLEEMARAALKLGNHLEGDPMPEHGPAEVRATARAFNVMQQRLKRYVGDRAAMLAALSHDLKTFITRLRLRTELLPESPHRDRLAADLSDMAAMVDGTLDYLYGSTHDRETLDVDLNALVASVCIDAQDIGGAASSSGFAASPYRANARDLRRCLGNLVENAIKYGGRADISVTDSPEEVQIAVRDPGAGIPAEEMERVFEPFYRVDSSRSRELGGTGLGLSIARDIARAHGGDVTLENTPAGFVATMHLPRIATT